MKKIVRFFLPLIILLVLLTASALRAGGIYPVAAAFGEDAARQGGVPGEARLIPGKVVSRHGFLSVVIRETGLNLDGIYFFKAPEVRDVAADVSEEAPYAWDLIVAGHYGVVENGRPFRPDDPVLREEAASMTVRTLYAKLGPLPLTKQLIIFEDAGRISPRYINEVQDACKLGLFQAGKSFRPEDPLSGEEFSALLESIKGLVQSRENRDGVTWRLSEDSKTVTLYWGEKPTGGYAITIMSIKREGNVLKVVYSLRSPGPGEIVTQAITHPRAVAQLPDDIGTFTEVQPVSIPGSPVAVFTIGVKSYMVGGRPLPMDAAPFIENGRAFLPVRFLAQALGVPEKGVVWSPSARAVTLIKEGISISLAPGGNIMYVSNRPLEMDVVPVLREGRVYLPARYIAEALGYMVEWDSGSQSVIIVPGDPGPAETVYSRMSVGLYHGDSPLELQDAGRLEAGGKVVVKEKSPPWVLVQAGPVEGWLPRWYLAEDSGDLLPPIEPYTMVVKKQASGYLYPDKEAPRILGLDAGKVVRVEYEYGDWRYVRIAVFSIPAVHRGWIPAEYLGTRDEAAPLEGIIPPGTRVYNEGPFNDHVLSLQEEPVTYDMRVYVSSEKGDMVYVQAVGGWGGWVYKKDIIFDPFSNL
ncbi:MAG: stalk domain-containing protein [Desulfocucumaceae bacterium]